MVTSIRATLARLCAGVLLFEREDALIGLGDGGSGDRAAPRRGEHRAVSRRPRALGCGDQDDVGAGLVGAHCCGAGAALSGRTFEIVGDDHASMSQPCLSKPPIPALETPAECAASRFSYTAVDTMIMGICAEISASYGIRSSLLTLSVCSALSVSVSAAPTPGKWLAVGATPSDSMPGANATVVSRTVVALIPNERCCCQMNADAECATSATGARFTLIPTACSAAADMRERAEIWANRCACLQ